MKMLLSAILRSEDAEPQAVLDWLVETARKIGAPSEQAQALPYIGATTGQELLLVAAVLTCERADLDQHAVLTLIEEAAGKAGIATPLLQVTAYHPPAAPDPTLTEVGVPE
jgi:hypothetical protein